MDTNQQPRHGKGTKAGGQWAPKAVADTPAAAGSFVLDGSPDHAPYLTVVGGNDQHIGELITVGLEGEIAACVHILPDPGDVAERAILEADDGRGAMDLAERLADQCWARTESSIREEAARIVEFAAGDLYEVDYDGATLTVKRDSSWCEARLSPDQFLEYDAPFTDPPPGSSVTRRDKYREAVHNEVINSI